MADYYEMAIIPARVKKPRDKSAAEGSVFSVATTIIVSYVTELSSLLNL